jgi:hypothetical protein
MAELRAACKGPRVFGNKDLTTIHRLMRSITDEILPSDDTESAAARQEVQHVLQRDEELRAHSSCVMLQCDACAPTQVMHRAALNAVLSEAKVDAILARAQLDGTPLEIQFEKRCEHSCAFVANAATSALLHASLFDLRDTDWSTTAHDELLGKLGAIAASAPAPSTIVFRVDDAGGWLPHADAGATTIAVLPANGQWCNYVARLAPAAIVACCATSEPFAHSLATAASTSVLVYGECLKDLLLRLRAAPLTTGLLLLEQKCLHACESISKRERDCVALCELRDQLNAQLAQCDSLGERASEAVRRSLQAASPVDIAATVANSLRECTPFTMLPQCDARVTAFASAVAAAMDQQRREQPSLFVGSSVLRSFFTAASAMFHSSAHTMDESELAQRCRAFARDVVNAQLNDNAAAILALRSDKSVAEYNRVVSTHACIATLLSELDCATQNRPHVASLLSVAESRDVGRHGRVAAVSVNGCDVAIKCVALNDAAMRELHVLRYLTVRGVDCAVSLHGAATVAAQTPILLLLLAPLCDMRLCDWLGANFAQLTLVDSMQLGVCLARAVAMLHALGITHGDLKSTNVLVTWDGSADDGGAFRVVLADFGSATLQQSSYSGSNQILPADVRACSDDVRLVLTPKSDVFALGLLLSEIAAPKEMHERVTACMLPYELPTTTLSSYRTAVERCLAPCASARPSAAQLVEELEQMLVQILPN